MAGRRPYQPWRIDVKRAWLCGLVAVLALSTGFADGTPGALAAGGALALVMVWGVVYCLRRARNRRFGLDFEALASARIVALLDRKGVRWRRNILVAGHGDVDLVVYGPRGPVVVEIKSFRRWRQLLCLAGGRERAAMRQARRGQQALDARHALVWLPQGRPGWLVRTFGAGSRGVDVVMGPAPALLEHVS